MKNYGLIKDNSRKGAFRLSFLFLCLFMLSGCAGSIMESGRSVPQESSCDEFDSQTCVDSSQDELIDYTQVAADYKAYGERNPRDQMVGHSGAGSNLSSSIAPSIEGEVLEYESQISMNDGTNSNYGGASDGSTVDDPVEDWLAEEGGTLKQVITEWGDKSGWRVVWNTNRNYRITAGAMFRGRFADVSSALVRAFARARPAPIATFYKGNRVLVIETMEDENAYN